jgi:hypothetical protein
LPVELEKGVVQQLVGLEFDSILDPKLLWEAVLVFFCPRPYSKCPCWAVAAGLDSLTWKLFVPGLTVQSW